MEEHNKCSGSGQSKVRYRLQARSGPRPRTPEKEGKRLPDWMNRPRRPFS